MKKKVLKTKTKSKTKKIFKKKPCRMCKKKIQDVDYKDIEFIINFISDRGKIVPSRISGNCSKHQRLVANRVKRARMAGLIPYVKAKRGINRESDSHRER